MSARDGWVYGRGYPEGFGMRGSRETLTSFLGWFDAEPGEEWVHGEIEPGTWKVWDYPPEWRYRARLVDGRTVRTGDVEAIA